MCVGGPPKPMQPMRPHSAAIVRRATCGWSRRAGRSRRWVTLAAISHTPPALAPSTAAGCSRRLQSRLVVAVRASIARVVDIRAEIERVYRERFATYVGATAGIVGSREHARDVVQDGFARALAHEARFRGGSLEAWIWQIVLNRARGSRSAA